MKTKKKEFIYIYRFVYRLFDSMTVLMMMMIWFAHLEHFLLVVLSMTSFSYYAGDWDLTSASDET